MPIYEYECGSCGFCFERKQRFDEEPVSICPECEGKVNVSGTPKIGFKVTCPHCGEKLEVFNLKPLELDYEYDDDDDDDDDDDGDDDY